MKEQTQPTKKPIIGRQIEYIEKFMDSLDKPTWLIDVNSYILIRINITARALGIKEGIPCYRAFFNRKEPCDEGTGIKCNIKELQKGKPRLFSIKEHTLKDGSKRMLEVYHYPICDEEGKITHMMEYCDDVSERVLVERTFKELSKVCKTPNQDIVAKQLSEEDSKKAGIWFRHTEEVILSSWRGNIKKDLIQAKLELESLQQLERFKTELLSTVSHELRNPLSSIKGYTSTLLAEDVEWSKDKQRDFLLEINEETDRLNRLIGDLLDMSRIEASMLKLEKGPRDICSLFESIKGRLAIITQHHQLEAATPEELPMVYIDEMRIGQVITNLVENAARFSDRGSMIRLDAALDDGQVVISVTDNGVGIPKEDLDKVFDRFYSTDDTSSGQRKGLGLGLSICRGIVESHGGEIWVESKPRQGSKFSFRLLVADHSTKLGEPK